MRSGDGNSWLAWMTSFVEQDTAVRCVSVLRQCSHNLMHSFGCGACGDARLTYPPKSTLGHPEPRPRLRPVGTYLHTTRRFCPGRRYLDTYFILVYHFVPSAPQQSRHRPWTVDTPFWTNSSATRAHAQIERDFIGFDMSQSKPPEDGPRPSSSSSQACLPTASHLVPVPRFHLQRTAHAIQQSQRHWHSRLGLENEGNNT